MTGSLLHDYIGFCLIINALSKLRILPFLFFVYVQEKVRLKNYAVLWCRLVKTPFFQPLWQVGSRQVIFFDVIFGELKKKDQQEEERK